MSQLSVVGLPNIHTNADSMPSRRDFMKLHTMVVVSPDLSRKSRHIATLLALHHHPHCVLPGVEGDQTRRIRWEDEPHVRGTPGTTARPELVKSSAHLEFSPTIRSCEKLFNHQTRITPSYPPEKRRSESVENSRVRMAAPWQFRFPTVVPDSRSHRTRAASFKILTTNRL